MEYIKLSISSFLTLKDFGEIVYNGEKIQLPSANSFADRIIVLEEDDKLESYVLLHLTKDGRKIIVDYRTISLAMSLKDALSF